MTRRDAVVALASLAALSAVPFNVPALGALPAQMDPDFLRMFDEAQHDRPPVLSASARLAPVNEPGTPMRVRGTIFDRDGTTPKAGAVVFGYQTDHTGVYGPRGAKTWRLKAWAKADAQGHFQFDTIRPAPYPNRHVGAHIHFHADGGGVPRQTLPALMFEGDPLITDAERAESASLGERFRFIVPVRAVAGRDECEILFRVTGEQIF